MSILHMAPALEALETISIWGSKITLIGSEVFTISAILWTLNFLATLTEKVYNAGVVIGTFYRQHLHNAFKIGLSKLIKLSISFLAFLILSSIILGELTVKGCKIVYNNRQEILETLNNFRNKVGSYFVYPAYA